MVEAPLGSAEVAELADASVSNTDVRKDVRVRLPLSAPHGLNGGGGSHGYAEGELVAVSGAYRSDRLWIASILASAAGFAWMFLLPPLAVGTPLKLVLGLLGPVYVIVAFGLVALGIVVGLVGIVRSRRRWPAIVATIVGLLMVVAVTFPFFIGGD